MNVKIRRFFGKDMRDALNQVKDELGGDAVIMSNKKIADGVEIVAAYDKEPAPEVKLKKKIAVAGQSQTPSLSEIIGDSGPDSLRALLEKQSQSSAKQDAAVNIQQQPAKVNQTGDATSSNPNNTDLSAIDDIRQELKSLRNVLQFQVSGLLTQHNRKRHPMQGYLISRLEQMGINTELAEEVVSYAPEDSDERQAWVFLLKLLANRLSTTGNAILNDSGVVALVGPTGTGKTTTIAKLAARYAQKYGADQVALVTIDTYRIAAYEQLATYGKIIGCAVKKAQNESELADILYQFRSKRLVLVDTAGFGQRDSRLIKQLDTLNQHSCATIKKYLVIQANAQYQVMERTIAAYQKISLQGCIFTKLDECYSLGEAISAAIVHGLSVGYLTDGQKVPEDLKVADSKYIISTAAKLYKKYGLTHTASHEDVEAQVS
jgi:flagellar biosynthesis protein FlhF